MSAERSTDRLARVALSAAIFTVAALLCWYFRSVLVYIVLLIAGCIGGAIGLLVAIPSYTVLRVIASRFFYHWKPVRRLIPDREEERS